MEDGLEDNFEDGIISECPMCGEDNAPIGSLGGVLHFRCRACGWMYSITEGQED